MMDLLTHIETLKKSPQQKLEMALELNNLSEIKDLLAGGIDPNTKLYKQGGNCALHKAAGDGLFLCVETLLEFNADPNIKNDLNLIPFQLAFRRNQVKCVEILLRVSQELHSLELIWLENAAHVWKVASDNMISTLIRATPDLAKCRQNLQNNLLMICRNRKLLQSAKMLVMGGYKLTEEDTKLFSSFEDSSITNCRHKYDGKINSINNTWFYKQQQETHSLMYHCRITIRKSFHGNCNVLYGIEAFSLPKSIKKYLLLKDDV